jgi:hypothetical protein
VDAAIVVGRLHAILHVTRLLTPACRHRHAGEPEVNRIGDHAVGLGLRKNLVRVDDVTEAPKRRDDRAFVFSRWPS